VFGRSRQPKEQRIGFVEAFWSDDPPANRAETASGTLANRVAYERSSMEYQMADAIKSGLWSTGLTTGEAAAAAGINKQALELALQEPSRISLALLATVAAITGQHVEIIFVNDTET
jgi:hypothetical protein